MGSWVIAHTPALAAGMTIQQCAETNKSAESQPIAAIVNWYGITDVADLLEGENIKTYAVQWLGSMPNRVEVARRVSPLTYVRPGLPPIISIQSDADPVVPYSHSVRLKQALEKAGIAHELVTIPGGRHGNFTRAENQRAYTAIKAFLARHGLGSWS